MEKVAVIGNCQSYPLAELLSVLCSKMKFLNQPPVHLITELEVANFLSSLDSFDAVITHPVGTGYRNNIGIDTDNIRSKMRANQQLLVIPNLHFEGLFPTWGYMQYKDSLLGGTMRQGLLPDCASEGMFATIQRSDYKCFFLLCAWLKGVKTGNTVKLLEKSCDFDLIRLWYADSLSEFTVREQSCDTRMHSILRNLRTHKEYQFYSFNHPNKALLFALAQQILNILKVESEEFEVTRSCVDNLPDRLSSIWLPVYPLVSSSLGIKNQQNTALRIYDDTFSIPEFVANYYAFFDCLGKDGLAVNCGHDKFKLCEKLLSAIDY